MSTQIVTIKPQGEANFYALLQGDKMLGEVQVNGQYWPEQQLELVQYAANFLLARFPIAPSNGVWDVSDEPNRLTLVQQSNNKPEWLLVLTH